MKNMIQTTPSGASPTHKIIWILNPTSCGTDTLVDAFKCRRKVKKHYKLEK